MEATFSSAISRADRSCCSCSSSGRLGFGVDVRGGTGRWGVDVLEPKMDGRREARNEARRDCVLGKGGSGEGTGCPIRLLIAVKLDEDDGAGEDVRIALKSSSRSAALSTRNGYQLVCKEGEREEMLLPANASFCDSCRTCDSSISIV